MNILLKMIKVLLFLCCMFLIFSCRKDEKIPTSTAIAKVNVINTVIGGGNVKANISGKEVAWNSLLNNHVIAYGTGKFFVVPSDPGTYLQVVSASDTAKYWYNNHRNLQEGKVYTLYLSGSKNAIDTLFREEENFPKAIVPDLSKPVPVADSIVNLRFVNLSPSGPAVDINIMDSNVKEATNLKYREATNFKAYSATANVNYIALEIRRSSDKKLIDTYYVNVASWGGNLFKSVAIVITGVYDPEFSLPIPYEDRYVVREVLYQ